MRRRIVLIFTEYIHLFWMKAEYPLIYNSALYLFVFLRDFSDGTELLSYYVLFSE